MATKKEEKATEAIQAPTVFNDEGPVLATTGLSDTDEVEIRHPDTGQRYGVSMAAFHDLYKPLGYEVYRKGASEQPETTPAILPESDDEQVIGEIPVEDDTEG